MMSSERVASPRIFNGGPKMRFALRPARPDDFDFCSRLYFQGMEAAIQHFQLDMVAQTTSLHESWNAHEVRIITSSGADVGWVQSLTANNALYLAQIFIDAAFQRRGIGTEVIQGLIDQATQAGQPVTLGVIKTNPARHLYQRLGFRITQENGHKFYMRREA
jgi:ribosomal protein S18 acetylase RimI-like enzyme